MNKVTVLMLIDSILFTFSKQTFYFAKDPKFPCFHEETKQFNFLNTYFFEASP